MMKVEFIHHSSVYIELENNVLIFDYVNGSNEQFTFNGTLPELPIDKNVYFFVSHGHHDHYDPVILDFIAEDDNSMLIADKSVGLSKFGLAKKGIEGRKYKKVDFGKKYKINDMVVTTIKSTESGVAFLVKCEDKIIFHAGDLALWYWDGVGDLINGRETAAYKREINKLVNEHIDVACVPLDPRMKGHAGDGMKYFMENIDCDMIIPIHMWNDYSVIDKFKGKCSNSSFAMRLCDINSENVILKND